MTAQTHNNQGEPWSWRSTTLQDHSASAAAIWWAESSNGMLTKEGRTFAPVEAISAATHINTNPP